MQGGFPEPGKPQGSAETCQELATLMRVTDEAWAGPGVTAGTTHSHKRQPQGALATRMGKQGVACQPGRGTAVCAAVHTGGHVFDGGVFHWPSGEA